MHNELGEYSVRAGPAAAGAWYTMIANMPLDKVLTAILILYTLAQFIDFVVVRVRRWKAAKRAQHGG